MSTVSECGHSLTIMTDGTKIWKRRGITVDVEAIQPRMRFHLESLVAMEAVAHRYRLYRDGELSMAEALGGKKVPI